MIDGAEGEIGAAHLAASQAQPLKGLRRGHLMHQMQIDVEQSRLRLLHARRRARPTAYRTSFRCVGNSVLYSTEKPQTAKYAMREFSASIVASAMRWPISFGAAGAGAFGGRQADRRCACPVLSTGFDGGLDALGFGVKLGGVAQQHGRRTDGADGIGNSLARDVRRGAVDRLVEIDLAADAGRGQHAERAGNDGRLVGENVSEEIFREHHIVAGGLGDDVHGEGIHQGVLERDLGEFGGDAGDHLTPEARGLQHVGLIDGDQLLAAALRRV